MKSAKRVNKAELKKFLDMIDDEDYANNWDENIERDKIMAINEAIESNKTEDDVFHSLRRQQFNYAPQSFMRTMTKLGYDMMTLYKKDFHFNDVDKTYHYIVYNPEIIEVVGVERNSIEENSKKAIRKIIKEVLSELSLVSTDTFPDLNIDQKWRVPQVGSKILDYDIKDGKIIFNQLHDPNKLYDFIINQKGELIIGIGHYKMAKKSDIIKAAGSLKINEEGEIYYIDNTSGHYRPQKSNLEIVFYVLNNMEVLSKDVKVNYKY